MFEAQPLISPFLRFLRPTPVAILGFLFQRPGFVAEDVGIRSRRVQDVRVAIGAR